MAERRPWFEVLGVAPDASALEVRSAYLALVRAWHPDRFASHECGAAEAEERESVFSHDEARVQRDLLAQVRRARDLRGHSDREPDPADLDHDRIGLDVQHGAAD